MTCLYVSIGEFKRAWAEGKTLPIALAMANTLLSALEVLFIVTEGVAKLVQSFATGSAVRLFAGSVVSAASTLTVGKWHGRFQSNRHPVAEATVVHSRGWIGIGHCYHRARRHVLYVH